MKNKIRYVYFVQAGNTHSDSDRVFLHSKHRATSIHHNNSYQRRFRFPADWFKENFKYNPQTKIYTNLNNVTYGDIVCFTRVEKLKGGYVPITDYSNEPYKKVSKIATLTYQSED